MPRSNISCVGWAFLAFWLSILGVKRILAWEFRDILAGFERLFVKLVRRLEYTMQIIGEIGAGRS